METEEISLEEFKKRSKKNGGTVPMIKAEAVVKIFDKDGNLKSTLNFSTEELNNAT